MNAISLRTTDGRTDFAPGETIEVEAEWSLEVQPDSAEINLVWYTQGKGSSDISVEQTISLPTPGISEKRRVSLSLPAAPYSFSGKYVSLLWGVEIVFSPTDDAFRLEIVMGPNRQEVMLYKDPVDAVKG